MCDEVRHIQPTDSSCSGNNSNEWMHVAISMWSDIAEQALTAQRMQCLHLVPVAPRAFADRPEAVQS